MTFTRVAWVLVFLRLSFYSCYFLFFNLLCKLSPAAQGGLTSWQENVGWDLALLSPGSCVILQRGDIGCGRATDTELFVHFVTNISCCQGVKKKKPNKTLGDKCV